MTQRSTDKLIIAISSRALFDLNEGHRVYENEGIQAYADHQIANENVILKPGGAFSVIKKLLAIKDPQSAQVLVEVILLSRNSADTGLRIFNSIQHYKLNITRAAFCSGQSPFHYIAPFDAHLFLSADRDDVKKTLQANHAAASILTEHINQDKIQTELRIAFDGDAVIFADHSERIYQEQGLAAFAANEKEHADKPLPGGPFKGFLQALHNIQQKFPAGQCPIKTALVTARAAPAHERVIRTLRAWDIRIDQALFLGGLSKGEFLKSFNADIFFDDQEIHCQSASQHVTTGHVPHGVTNSDKS